MDRCICMAACLHGSPKTITTSLVNQLYPNTKLKAFKKKTVFRSSMPQMLEWGKRGAKQERREGKWDGMQLTLAQSQVTCQLNTTWPPPSGLVSCDVSGQSVKGRGDWRSEETFSSVSPIGQRFVPQCFISTIFPVWTSGESWNGYISAATERKTLVLEREM